MTCFLRQAARAEQLARDGSAAGDLLRFHAVLARSQHHVYSRLQPVAGRFTGRLEEDLPLVAPCLPALVETVAHSGPAPLVREGSALVDAGPSALDEVLLAYWARPSAAQFFGKACLQPYARALADRGITADRSLPAADNRCPVCRSQPQVGVLRPSSASDAGGRHLICALCLSPWSFGRLVCVACGEADERRLGYYHAEAYDHVRVDACGACHSYIKTIDLARQGGADPITDDIASAPLDVWACEHGYRKIEMNLVGL